MAPIILPDAVKAMFRDAALLGRMALDILPPFRFLKIPQTDGTHG